MVHFMDASYALAPFLAWLIAGTSKFIINSIKAGRWAFHLIGYGGLPSTHSSIVSSTVALIAMREGIGHPAFGVAITLAFVVLLDAGSLRRQVGRQAEIINQLNQKYRKTTPLRERMGHSKLEIFAGVIVGVASAGLIFIVSAN